MTMAIFQYQVCLQEQTANRPPLLSTTTTGEGFAINRRTKNNQ